MSAVELRPSRAEVAITELAKLPAFLRRDFLVAWSYRLAFFSDLIGMVFMVTVFYFVGRMVDPSKLPTYGGRQATYMEFVVIGIAVGAFIQLGLGRVMAAIRSEQLMGTLESLLMTPTAASTIQLGSVFYDLLYIPLRTGLFLAVAGVAFDLRFEWSAVGRAAVILLAFVPVVWGLGVVSAAGVLTFRRGSGVVGLGAAMLTLASGAYFPVTLLPHWLAATADLNPIAIALEGMRESLLGGAGWSRVASDLAVLVPAAALSLALGVIAFRLALRRERRTGTLGLY